MRHAFPRPKTVLLAAFLLLIAAPWASAAPRHGSPQPARISGGIAIPDVLSLAWSFMTGGWMKEGCTIEPDGRCHGTSSPIVQPGDTGEPGDNVDAKRRRRPIPPPTSPLPTKEGCQVEPGGRCNP